jgi:carboxypeptidase Q
LKALSRPSRRTVRFALFGGEKEGLMGSVAYVRQHAADLDKIDAVLNTDSGSEAAKGWMLMGREDEKGAVEALKPLLSGRGADGITLDATYALFEDQAPFEFRGVPELMLWTGAEKYETLHHKASDTFDSVVQNNLSQGAEVIAVTAFALADSSQLFALPSFAGGGAQHGGEIGKPSRVRLLQGSRRPALVGFGTRCGTLLVKDLKLGGETANY